MEGEYIGGFEARKVEIHISRRLFGRAEEEVW